MRGHIRVHRLSKSIPVGFFGRPKALLHEVTFEVPAGATVGFVGPNGAGKSTTIKHLIGAARPSAGEVWIGELPPTDIRARQSMGYMPEIPYLPKTLTALEVLRLHAALVSCADPKRIDAMLALVDLVPAANSIVGTFSKGMQTRLCLALAMLNDPQVLILDEPMSGLDPIGRRLVREAISSERARGKTILFSSHVLSDVEILCDRVVAVASGRIVFDGSTTEALGAVTGYQFHLYAHQEPSLPKQVRCVREGDAWCVDVDVAASDVAGSIAAAAAQGQLISFSPRRPTLESQLLSWIEKAAVNA